MENQEYKNYTTSRYKLIANKVMSDGVKADRVVTKESIQGLTRSKVRFFNAYAGCIETGLTEIFEALGVKVDVSSLLVVDKEKHKQSFVNQTTFNDEDIYLLCKQIAEQAENVINKLNSIT